MKTNNDTKIYFFNYNYVMRKALSYIRLGLTIGIMIIFYDLFYFKKYARHPEKYPREERYNRLRKLTLAIFKCFRVKLIVEGKEYLENNNEKVLYVSNHLSEADPLVLIALSEKPISFVAKKESLKMPFVGTTVKILEGIPIDRHNLMNQLSEIKKIVNYIKQVDGPNIVIFPEGTRNKKPEKPCLEFKGGSIKMGYMAKVPIVPISMYGTFRILSIKHYLKEYPLFVRIHKPIANEEYKEIQSVDLADQIASTINKDVDEFREKDLKEIYKQKGLGRKRRILEIKPDKKLPS